MPDNCIPSEPLPCPSCGTEPSSPGPGPGAGDVCCSPAVATVSLCRTDDCSPVTLGLTTSCGSCGDPDPDPPAPGRTHAAGTFTPGPPPDGLGPCTSCTDQESPPEPCTPTPMCPGMVGLTGPETWTIPAGTESVHLSVVCGPVTVYPCTGATDGVVINECGTSFSWTAPGTNCEPGVLCTDFAVEVPDGGAAYVTWLAAGCGDQS